MYTNEEKGRPAPAVPGTGLPPFGTDRMRALDIDLSQTRKRKERSSVGMEGPSSHPSVLAGFLPCCSNITGHLGNRSPYNSFHPRFQPQKIY